MKSDEELLKIGQKYKVGTPPADSSELRGSSLLSSINSEDNNSDTGVNPLLPKKSFLDKATNFVNKAGEFGGSAGSTIWNTLKTGLSGAERVLQAPLKLAGVPLPEKTTAEELFPKELVTPTPTKAGQAGSVFGEAVQYLTPMGAETAVAKGSTLLGKLLAKAPKALPLAKTVLKSVVGGAELAGKTALMGGDEESIKESGIIGLATPPALKAVSKTGKFVFGDVAPALMGSMLGVAPETVKMAFKNPVAVANYMSKKVIPIDVRNKAIKSLSNYRQKVSSSFDIGLKDLAKLSPRIKQARTAPMPGVPGVFSGVKSQFNEALNTGTENIKNTLNKFRISVKGNKLDFNKLNSAIVSPTEQKQIQNVWDTLNNQKDFSARGVQDVAARINALSKFTDGVKTQSSAVISKMHDVYSKAINKVYPELGKLRAEYSASQEIIKGIDDILKSAKNDIANPNTSTSVAKKLVNLFNKDNEAYVRALKKLEEETGDDLINQFVATNFDKALPGRIGSILGTAGAIGAYFNPALIAVLPLFSPKLMGQVITKAGKGAKMVEKLAPAKRFLPNILK